MIKNFPNGCIFGFSNSAYYFMRVERDGIPYAVRLWTADILSEEDLIKECYENPKVLYKDLDALYYED